MPSKKKRVEIPQELADEILFLSDRTCCKCRITGKPVQIHHIDEDPSNNHQSNLAVLCLECHDETQVSGGFGRKLSAGQVRRYKDEWLAQVAKRRAPTVAPAVDVDELKRQVYEDLQRRMRIEDLLNRVGY